MASDATAGDEFGDARIVESWHKNATPWTEAIRRNEIESRRLVTNAAVVDAVLGRKPRTVLDIGCGEGWLVRALASHGVTGIGVDAVPELIASARIAGGGDFRVVPYADIADGKLDVRVDCAVANFSLIGRMDVERLLARVPQLLTAKGALVIQTLHPVTASEDEPYVDGWRRGSWAGFNASFCDPAPWYFRTVESWVALLRSSGLRLLETREPLHPVSGRPASIVFITDTAG